MKTQMGKAAAAMRLGKRTKLRRLSLTWTTAAVSRERRTVGSTLTSMQLHASFLASKGIKSKKG